MSNLGIFIAALAVVYLIPGPDMLLILHTAAYQGRKAAYANAMGLAVARALHVALAGFGLAALLHNAPWAFNAARWLGAAYLIWLGIQLLQTPSLVAEHAQTNAHSSANYLSALRLGLFTNLLNPKALLFCSVLLPQFIQAEYGQIAVQFGLLGVILVGIGLVFDLMYAHTGQRLGAWLSCHPRLQQVQKYSFALLLIGFGVRLGM